VESPDIIIVGAGIIGLSLALELRERGASVTVMDRGLPGHEASSAAAGMLAAADPETPAALRDFALESARMYPEFVGRLEALSGSNVDFRSQGTIILQDLNEHRQFPSPCRSLTATEVAAMEPALKSDGNAAYWLAEDSIDPVLLMKAAVRAAEINGVKILSHSKVSELRSVEGQVEVSGCNLRLSAKIAVDCRGAWSGAPVVPKKGQMLYLHPRRQGILQYVVRAPGAYIVPRSSGRILVGTTVEDAGFDKSVEAATIEQLHHAAGKYVPELSSASVSESWAGLRPGTPDELPIMGPSQTPGVFIASGHFRNGILLAPMTASVMADLVEGKTLAFDIAAFSPARFAVTDIHKAS
jgi:glycine oxidase